MKTISQMRKNYIKKDFIVDNLMKSKGLYSLVARPKVGKSLLALQLANSVATGTSFLGYRTTPSPVLYISTEMNSSQLLNRIDIMNLQLNDNNFGLVEQEPNEGKLDIFKLKYEIDEFVNEKNGKLVIIDMFTGIQLNCGYDLNNYQDIGQQVLPAFRELCNKCGVTILLVHHLNKNNTSLGSTALDGSIDGKITLKLDKNIRNKVLFNYESRDYQGLDLILKMNDNLIFELSDIESEDLNYNLLVFLNYAIKQKEFNFTSAEITSKLNLPILPSTFGKLLNANLSNLEKEGLHIEQKRTSNDRTYYAKYEEPINEND